MIKKKELENEDLVFDIAWIAQQWRNMGDYQKALTQFERVLGKNL